MNRDEEQHSVEGADERAPLLPEIVPPGALGEPTPLPRAQLAAVYFIKLTIPVVSTQVTPYINKMVSELDLPAGHPVGYYTGLTGLGHGVGQFLTVLPWGRLSDRVGRTWIIAFGIFGLVVSNVWFGLSKSFAQVLVSRFLMGVFSGYIGVIHSVVGELSDATNQSSAFPFYDIIAAVGFIIGPIIGGTFADPATELSAWFDTPFWREYPYVLPCFVSGAMGICATLLSIFYLKETNPRGRGKKLLGQPSAFPVAHLPSSSIAAEEEKPPSIKSLLSLPAIRAICESQWVMGFLAAAFNTGFVLMAFTPVDQGGLSMKPLRIAFALSIMGFVSIGLKASLPIALRRYDTLAVYRFTAKVWPLTFALMPILNMIARSAAGEALLWVSVSVVLLMSRINTMGFGIIMILTKDHTPMTSALGTTNSISELAQMVGISVGTPVVSSLFSFSTATTSAFMGGYLWAIVFCVLAASADLIASRIAKYRPQL